MEQNRHPHLDGGKLGSKPYAASGNYINRMSDYCQGCRFDLRLRVGPNACPFNSLYWDFLVRNREKLRGNLRLKQAYATWGRTKETDQSALRRQAQQVLTALY